MENFICRQKIIGKDVIVKNAQKKQSAMPYE